MRSTRSMDWVDAGIMPERMDQGCRETGFIGAAIAAQQKHIDEIAWYFQGSATEWGCLPQGERAAIGFDAAMNDTPRRSKGQKILLAECLKWSLTGYVNIALLMSRVSKVPWSGVWWRGERSKLFIKRQGEAKWRFTRFSG